MSVSDDPGMKSIIASVATICALLATDGLQGAGAADAAGVGIVPVLDVPAPVFTGQNAGRGGQATRIELDEVQLYDDMSAWYRLAYVPGGTRLQVFEHSAVGTLGPDADIVRSAGTAWQVANRLVEQENRSTAADLPSWAHVRTGNTDGPSAGLIFTLSYIDLLTPGALVGDLRVAATGGITIDGMAFAVSGIDVKIATARLTQPDVIFITEWPSAIDSVTNVVSESGHVPVGSDIAEFLNLSGYERSGQSAARHRGTAAVVLVHDVRQALAWLCGRTERAGVCAIAQRSTSIRLEIP